MTPGARPWTIRNAPSRSRGIPDLPIPECEQPIIHHSVIDKMQRGRENYAPVALPSNARVLQADGTLTPIDGFDDDETPETARPAHFWNRPRANPAHVAARLLPKPERELVALTRDLIWWRRVAYFAFLASVVVAAALPITAY